METKRGDTCTRFVELQNRSKTATYAIKPDFNVLLSPLRIVTFQAKTTSEKLFRPICKRAIISRP